MKPRVQESRHCGSVTPNTQGWKTAADERGSAAIELVLLVPALMLASLVGLLESAPALPVFTLVVFTAGWVVLGMERQAGPDRAELRSLFAWGFVLRMAYGIFLYYFLIHTRGEPFLGGGDDWSLEQMSERMHDLWQLENYEMPWRHPAYPVFLVLVRFAADPVGGYHTLLPPLLNA